MTPAARLSAAIEALADIAERRRPAAQALKDWGLSHRFAGSGDRAAIAGLTYDALREASVLQRLRGRAAALRDIGEGFDRGGESCGRRHNMSMRTAKMIHITSNTNMPAAKTLKRVGTWFEVVWI